MAVIITEKGIKMSEQDRIKLRDEFAKSVLTGIYANSSQTESGRGYFEFASFDEMAQLAYSQADSMLKARDVGCNNSTRGELK